MAIITNKPTERDGKVYDHLAINLAMSQTKHETGTRLSIAVRLTPYCLGEDGPEWLDEESHAIVFGDAMVDAQSDPALAAFLNALESAGQEFINARGL